MGPLRESQTSSVRSFLLLATLKRLASVHVSTGTTIASGWAEVQPSTCETKDSVTSKALWRRRLHGVSQGLTISALGSLRAGSFLSPQLRCPCRASRDSAKLRRANFCQQQLHRQNDGHAPSSESRLEVASGATLLAEIEKRKVRQQSGCVSHPAGRWSFPDPCGNGPQAWRSSATSGQLIHARDGGPLMGIESYAAEAGTGSFFPKRQGVPLGREFLQERSGSPVGRYIGKSSRSRRNAGGGAERFCSDSPSCRSASSHARK